MYLRDEKLAREVGRRIREHRTAKGLSQYDFDDIHQNSVSRYERGEAIPSLPVLLRLAEALKCRVADLVPEGEAA